MKKFLGIAKPRRSLLLASAFAPICFGALIGGVGPSNLQSPTRSDIKIINNTTTLEVISVQPTDHNLLVIRLKNISSKDLNGYEVNIRGYARITTDTSSGDWAISPGTTNDLEFPGEYASSEITILAAMFADGSIDGDPASVTDIKQRRSALKRQLTRALPLLDAALESQDVNTPEALDRLESQFSSLSLESDHARPHSASGSRSAKGDLISEIGSLRERRQRNGDFMQRQRLLDLKRRIERRIASL